MARRALTTLDLGPSTLDQERIPNRRPLPREPLERGVGVFAGHDLGEDGQGRDEVALQVERAALGDGAGRAHELGVMAEPARHHARGLEGAEVVREEAIARVVDRAGVLDAAEDVLDRLEAAGHVVHVVGRDHAVGDAVRGGAAEALGDREDGLGGEALLGERVVLHLEDQVVAEDLAPGLDEPEPLVDVAAGEGGGERTVEERGQRDEPLGARGDLFDGHVRSAARALEAALRDQRAEVRPAGRVLREEHEAEDVVPHRPRDRAAGERRRVMCGAAPIEERRRADGDLGAEDGAQAGLVARLEEPDVPADVVAIDEGEGLVAEIRRALGELLGERGALEERERAVRVQLDVLHVLV